MYLSNPAATVKSAKLLIADIRSFESDVLYIGNIMDFPENLPEQNCLNLLCLTTGAISNIWTKYPEINWILVHEFTNVGVLFNAVQDILSTQLNLLQYSNQGNQAESANELRIHRATMIYRMEKIRKITQLDFKNAETINHLNISYMILKYLEKFPQKHN